MEVTFVLSSHLGLSSNSSSQAVLTFGSWGLGPAFNVPYLVLVQSVFLAKVIFAFLPKGLL